GSAYVRGNHRLACACGRRARLRWISLPWPSPVLASAFGVLRWLCEVAASGNRSANAERLRPHESEPGVARNRGARAPGIDVLGPISLWLACTALDRE